MKQLTLRMWTSDEAQHRLVVVPLPCVIGRDATCELVLDDTQVSRRHAELHWDEDMDVICLTDLGSVNGTYIDGRPAKRATLNAEQVAVIGSHSLRLDAPRHAERVERKMDTSETSIWCEAPIAEDEHALAFVCHAVRERLREEALQDETELDVALPLWIDEAIATLALKGEHIPKVRQRAMAELIGYGPLQDLIADTEINEIMVNGPDHVFVEKHGDVQRVAVSFQDQQSLYTVIRRIVTPLGRRIDEASPMVDARLPDGSRVHAVVPPIALDGPVLTIRKFKPQAITMSDLLAGEALSESMAAYLQDAVFNHANILVSGGTGSGKTTLLNALSSFIPSQERIVTIEDAAELRLSQPHVVRLEARPNNAEGVGAVPIRALVRNALRMRPDRIVVGECRGAEALDMLQAMNTGHDGSLTTAHANSPRDALARIETMCLMADLGLPHRAIREQVVRAIDVVVQLARLPDGTRRMIEIVEVQHLEGDTPVLQPRFRYDRNAGQFTDHHAVFGEHAA